MENASNNPYKFKIALSFSGKYRALIEAVCKEIMNLGFRRDEIFYDDWHKEIFIGHNGIEKIKKVYHDSDFVVVLLSPDYSEKNWTGFVEWKTILKMINEGKEKICLLRIDGVDLNTIEGLSSGLDVVADIDNMTEREIARFIIDCYQLSMKRRESPDKPKPSFWSKNKYYIIGGIGILIAVAMILIISSLSAPSGNIDSSIPVDNHSAAGQGQTADISTATSSVNISTEENVISTDDTGTITLYRYGAWNGEKGNWCCNCDSDLHKTYTLVWTEWSPTRVEPTVSPTDGNILRILCGYGVADNHPHQYYIGTLDKDARLAYGINGRLKDYWYDYVIGDDDFYWEETKVVSAAEYYGN